VRRRARESLASWKRRLAKQSAAMRRRPGRSWRILANGRDVDFHVGSPALPPGLAGRAARILDVADSVFDELVIDDWLHLEMMDTRDWWMRIGDTVIWITVPTSGPVRVFVRKENE